jgi:hypothetical protein
VIPALTFLGPGIRGKGIMRAKTIMGKKFNNLIVFWRLSNLHSYAMEDGKY